MLIKTGLVSVNSNANMFYLRHCKAYYLCVVLFDFRYLIHFFIEWPPQSQFSAAKIYQ